MAASRGMANGMNAGTGGLWSPAQRALTLGLVLTMTFVASEALAVITVLPVVARDLGGLELYGWVFSAFMLGSLVGIVAAGRDADRVGPARPYVAGLLLFGLGLTVAGLAPSMEVLVLGRALQGVGAGAIPAVAYVVIGRTLPEHQRARMLAVLSTAWVVPGLIGPAISAGVAHLFGWRWVFLGLLPLVGAAGSLAVPTLARLGRPRAQVTEEHQLLDAVRAAVGVGLLLGGLSARQVVLAVPLVVVGGVVAYRALNRLLPKGTLHAKRGLPAAILSRGLLTFAFFGGDAFVTLSIVTARHGGTALASAAVTGATLAWTAGAWVQARLHERCEGSRLVRIGVTLILLGLAAMVVVLRASLPVPLAAVAWTVAGLGMGLAYAPTSLMVLREAPAGREGRASASLNLSEVLGTALGAGLGGAVVAAASSAGWTVSTGVTLAFLVAASGALVELAVTRRLPAVAEVHP